MSSAPFIQPQLPLPDFMVVDGATPLKEAFTFSEWLDLAATAFERGIGVYELVHDAVMNDLYR